MSKHNYSQYSKKNDNHKPEPKPIAPEIKPEVKPEVKPEIEPIIPEMKVVEETVSTVVLPKFVSGVVVDCVKLNVREEPSTSAEVVCVLDVMSEIEIDVDKSTNEWLKVCTVMGIEGYCMRKFVDAHL